MLKLRSLHLYLGCIFAPLLLFFAISGIWQLALGYQQSKALVWLSTIHTSHVLKVGGTLSSPLLRCFVFVMAASFIVTTVLGVVMAVKYGRSRQAVYRCLAFGVLFPLVLILVAYQRSENAVLRRQQAQASNPDSVIAQLALAAANGKFDALTEMNKLCRATALSSVTESDRGDKFRAFRQAFDDLGARAGQGSDNAVESLLRAIQLDDLQGFAVDGLGEAAGMGNQKALEPLLHPAEYHILPSRVLFALKPAAENGNQKAIEALAGMAADPAFRYGVVDALQKAATLAGNVTAIDALAEVAKGRNDSESKLAIGLLETASSNHIARATEVLQALTGK